MHKCLACGGEHSTTIETHLCRPTRPRSDLTAYLVTDPNMGDPNMELWDEVQKTSFLHVLSACGVEWEELMEAGLTCDTRIPTLGDQLAAGRALAWVLSKKLGKPQPGKLDHPMAGSCLFLQRDGQFGYSLQSGYTTVDINTGVSRYADECLDEWVERLNRHTQQNGLEFRGNFTDSERRET